MRSLLYRTGLFLFGLIAITFGFALIIEAQLGNDTIGVFAQGIAVQSGLTIGNGSQIINSAAIILLLVWNRRLIGAGTIVSAVAIGLILDVCLARIGSPEGMTMQVIYLTVGIVIGGSGISITILSKMGASPVDSVMVVLSQRWHMPVRVTRIGMDIAMTISGWLMGGLLGWGTIITALLLGPVIQYSLYWLKKSNLIKCIPIQEDRAA